MCTQALSIYSKDMVLPLKWAGGKRRLLSQLMYFLPPTIGTKKVTRYFEPFLGGGAMFFFLASAGLIERAYLSDVNADLINFYKAVLYEAHSLCRESLLLEQTYNSLSEERRQNFYALKRREFNSTGLGSSVERAALFLFLNKACFNGLYRVNKRGDFNTSHGRYRQIKLINTDTAGWIKALFEKTRCEIFISDFNDKFLEKEILQSPDSSFVYYDPPYRALTKSSSFTAYSEKGFTDSDHIKLAKKVTRLAKYGVPQMLSNSNPKNTLPEDNFFEKLYEGYRISYISASRSINCKATKRGKITELIITNYSI